MTRVCILGATGSIGIQTLQVCRDMGYDVVAVAVNTGRGKLHGIYKDFKPGHIAIVEANAYEEFKSYGFDTEIYKGSDGVLELIRNCNADIIVNSIVGSTGILPTLEAVKSTKRLALANKEALVSAGEIVMRTAGECGCEIIPVDSEHSAIFQCLQGNDTKFVKNIILTASGGPFRGYKKKQLEAVTKEMALRHPNWVMGSKITIDSATLMNKGLEVIEARWMFGVSYDNIKVAVHPQSIIHSMVEFRDNSIIAQMGAPDMRVPIQYAITYPKRLGNEFKNLDVYEMGSLDFERPDTDTFRCLALAYDAGRMGGTMPCVMNAANEEAVKMFLAGKIKFTGIPEVIENVMEAHTPSVADAIDTIIKCDTWARKAAYGG
jgi:1-deoxy-D-xylulose-5-phosphate reductoisomerase